MPRRKKQQPPASPELTNHVGHAVAASPLHILANLFDKNAQLNHVDVRTKKPYCLSFVTDHGTGLTLCREESWSGIKYELCLGSEIEPVELHEALMAAELFMEHVNGYVME